MTDYIAMNVKQSRQPFGLPRPRWSLYGERTLANGTHPFIRPDVHPPVR